MVRRLVEAEYGFPENDREREGPWAGMTVENGRWSYNDNGEAVFAALVDGNQPEGCIQFAFDQDNGNVSHYRIQKAFNYFRQPLFSIRMLRKLTCSRA